MPEYYPVKVCPDCLTRQIVIKKEEGERCENPDCGSIVARNEAGRLYWKNPDWQGAPTQKKLRPGVYRSKQ